jgi:CRISPR/Cas system-associated exonuclease Cas4 (RecB family)
MATLEILTGKQHLSYSAVDSLAQCGERFRLERVAQVPQQPAWWFIGGSAFHLASEYIDQCLFGELDDDYDLGPLWQQAWNISYEDAIGDTDPSKIRAGGRATKEWPERENQKWWEHHLPLMLETYRSQMRALTSEGWMLWEPVPGQPAIELVFQLPINEVLIKGAIDRVFINPDGELVVVDLKTGSRQPESGMQLGVYSVALEHMFGMRPIVGQFYMARKGNLTDQVSLLHYSTEMIGNIFSTAKRMIEAEIFLPHVSGLCNACGVRDHCTAMAK